MKLGFFFFTYFFFFFWFITIFYWGYNRSFYTDSKISFFGPGYDFSLVGVQATDRPSPDFITYVDPSTLTVPQFNARIGFNFKKKWALSFGYDHMKYVIVHGPTYLLSGRINPLIDPISNWSGDYNAEPVTTDESILHYENTNGMNYIRAEISHIDKLVRASNAFAIYSVSGLGAGLVLNYNDFTFAGEKSMTTLSMSGVGASAHLGYVDGVLAGNALAVHDIEYATLGTSLGMNVKDATLACHVPLSINLVTVG